MRFQADEKMEWIVDDSKALAGLIIDWHATDRESCDRFAAEASASLDADPSRRE